MHVLYVIANDSHCYLTFHACIDIVRQGGDEQRGEMRRRRFEGNREFYAVVGRRIAEKRTGRMTQETLASKASLTRTSIVNIEKGRQQILLHTLVDIARALDVAPAELIPALDTLDLLLRDKPKKGADWIRSSVEKAQQKGT